MQLLLPIHKVTMTRNDRPDSDYVSNACGLGALKWYYSIGERNDYSTKKIKNYVLYFVGFVLLLIGVYSNL